MTPSTPPLPADALLFHRPSQ